MLVYIFAWQRGWQSGSEVQRKPRDAQCMHLLPLPLGAVTNHNTARYLPLYFCICVCVCVCERERNKEGKKERNKEIQCQDVWMYMFVSLNSFISVISLQLLRHKESADKCQYTVEVVCLSKVNDSLMVVELL